MYEVERLAGLVDELLELARADAAGGAQGDLQLGDVVDRRVELWSALAEERGVALEAHGDGAVVRAGESRVEQVLDNLLSNAFDASPHGATIVVSVDEGLLHVIDEGAGLCARPARARVRPLLARLHRARLGTRAVDREAAHRAGRRDDRAAGRRDGRDRRSRALSVPPRLSRIVRSGSYAALRWRQ